MSPGNLNHAEKATDPETKEHSDWVMAKILQKAVITDEQGNLLLLRRVETGPGARPGRWDLPGGSVSLEDCGGDQPNPHEIALYREVEEETGLKVSRLKVVHVASGVKSTQTAGTVFILAIGYSGEADGVKPSVDLSHEHVEYKWVSQQEALAFDFGEDGGLHPDIIRALAQTSR